MPTSTKQRRTLEKECNTLLRSVAKESGWKKASNFVFCSDSGFFFQASLSVFFNANRTVASFTAKPMLIDPILWDILGIPENISGPMSLRGNGAFSCSTPNFYEAEIENPDSTSDTIVDSFVNFAKASKDQFLAEYANIGFSQLISKDPNHIERGAYAITLVASLINESNYPQALDIALGHSTGKLSSCRQFSSKGQSFHDLAITWLSARKTQC